MCARFSGERVSGERRFPKTMHVSEYQHEWKKSPDFKYVNMDDFTTQCRAIFEKCKNNSAVCYWDESNNFRSLSYQDVSDTSAIITENLAKMLPNNQKRSCVGLYMEKNHYIPSIIISLQQCNTAFIFLNPKVSQQNNVNKCKMLNINWIISNCEDNFNLDKYYNSVGNIENLLVWKSKVIEEPSVDYSDVLYAICTSGTAGDPKTIRVSENCILCNINGLRDKFNLTEDDVIYFGTPLTFDPFVVELFLALTTGCSLVIPPRNRKFIFSSIDLLFQNSKTQKGITVLQTVPSLFLKCSVTDMEFILQKSTLRILAFGGEKFPEHVLNLPRSENLRLFNLYGITEVSCWASIFEVTGNEEVSLGEPLPETVLEVWDANGVKSDEGEGELHIRSGFRVCYVNDENKDDLILPVFRATGDLVQIKNGKLFYLGRTNNIIKRLGHKINLLKIRDIIMESTNISNACVWIESLNKLVLFIAIREFDFSVKTKIVDKLRVKLLKILPQESYPDDIEIVPNLPTTSHGKIDTETLKMFYQNLKKPQETNVIRLFQLVWCKYLGLSLDVAVTHLDSNFFDLGGNSITIVQCLSDFKELVGGDLPDHLNEIIFQKSLRDCCEHIRDIVVKVPRKRDHDGVFCQQPIKLQNSIDMTVKWKYCLNACVDSSPTIVNNTLVAIGSFSHKFALIDCSSGSVAIEVNLPDAIESACCSSPCGNYVYTGCYDGNMYCIENATGKIAWHYSTLDRIKCTPVITQNNCIIFGSYDKHLHCVDFNVGKALWKSDLSGGVTSTPLIHEDFVYVATILGTCFCIQCLTGEAVWKYKVGIPIFGAPCLVSEYQYIMWIDVEATLHAFRCFVGEKVWTFKVDGNVYSSMVHLHNSVIFGSSNGNLNCVEIQEDCGKLKYAVALDSSISSTPSVLCCENEYLCFAVTSKGIIYVTDVSKGGILGCLKLPGEIFSSPAILNSSIFVGCRDNNVYCIEFASK